MIQDGSHWYLQDIPPKCRRIHFFSSAHGTFSRIDHILGHKSNLSKFKKIEIISSIFSDHKSIRLENNYKKKIEKYKHTEAKQYATKQQTGQQRNQRGNLKIPWDKHTLICLINISNLWGTAKAVLTAKFTMIQAYLRNKKNLKQTI